MQGRYATMTVDVPKVAECGMDVKNIDPRVKL